MMLMSHSNKSKSLPRARAVFALADERLRLLSLAAWKSQGEAFHYFCSARSVSQTMTKPRLLIAKARFERIRGQLSRSEAAENPICGRTARATLVLSEGAPRHWPARALGRGFSSARSFAVKQLQACDRTKQPATLNANERQNFQVHAHGARAHWPPLRLASETFDRLLEFNVNNFHVRDRDCLRFAR